MIDFYEEVLKRGDEYIKLLGEWIEIPSIYDEDTINKDMPFGKEICRSLKWFENLALKDGFRVKNDYGYAVHAEYGQGNNYVCAFGHADVVPVDDNWRTNPFQLTVIDGKAYGRGVVDDKGPILGCYMGLKIIKELNLPVKNSIRIIVGGNEENGFRCIRHYFSKEPQPKFGFTPDAKFPVIHGEKGAAILEVSGIIKERIEIKSGTANNIIPSTIEIKLNTNYSYLKEKFISYLYENNLNGDFYINNDYTSIKVQGVGGHSSKPEKTVNPITKLVRFLSTNINTPLFLDLGNILFDNDYKGVGFGIYTSGKCGELTIVPTMFNINTDKMNLIFSIRYPENADLNSIKNKITKYICKNLKGEYQIKLKNIKNPFYIEPDFILVNKLHEIYINHTKDSKSKIRVTSAGTYASEMKNSVAFGAEFGDDSSGNVHSANEYMEVKRLFQSAAIYAHALYEMANM
ncbi:M20 family metallopeptidase [Caloramator sp. E03]|uniref:Sapep family Mn(2+)-dependent dipeptidase n=1 Tax=Caloramator sp. E03 TaxID=2576307 RepID=UPI001110244A|nr:Sapep family Mn(2+)-dependent dipeptidase [Caloramator sp. E03]QCX32867.1 M20 family metallopeptidase [Caloramator sp. E03]